jgi:hypothetical protein
MSDTLISKPEALFCALVLDKSPILLHPYQSLPDVAQIRLSGLNPINTKLIVFLLPHKQLRPKQVAHIYIKKEIASGLDHDVESNNWELKQVISEERKSVEISIIGRVTTFLRIILSVDGIEENLIKSTSDRLHDRIENLCALAKCANYVNTGRKLYQSFEETQIEQPITKCIHDLTIKLNKSVDQAKSLAKMHFSDIDRACTEIIQQSATRQNTNLQKLSNSENAIFLDWAEDKMQTLENLLGKFEQTNAVMSISSRLDLQNSTDKESIFQRIHNENEARMDTAVLIITAASSVQDKALDKVQNATEEEQKRRKELHNRMKLLTFEIKTMVHDDENNRIKF